MKNRNFMMLVKAVFYCLFLHLSTIIFTGCITVDPPKEIYTAAMVNKSGQKITVKSDNFDSNIPDFFILAPNDSVSWSCASNGRAEHMEIYFNDVLYKKYDNQSSDWRDPRVLWHYEKNSDGVYVYTFTPEDYEQFLNMDKLNQKP